MSASFTLFSEYSVTVRVPLLTTPPFQNSSSSKAGVKV